MQFIIKILISATIIALASEISKKSNLLSALIISLPVSSIIAISFYYYQTDNVKEVANYTTSILYLVIPSLAFFIMLPILLKQDVNFYLSMLISCLVTGICYVGTMKFLA